MASLRICTKVSKDNREREARGDHLRELCHDALDFTPIGGDDPESPPVVGFHLEISEREQSQDGAAQIADEHVQDPMIPPALGEVGQLVLQRVFQELEHDRDDGGEPPIAKDQGLAPIAEQMGENEHIEFVLEVVVGILGLIGVVNPTTAPVIFLRDGLACANSTLGITTKSTANNDHAHKQHQQLIWANNMKK